MRSRAYIRGSVMPRFMQRLRDIDAELRRHTLPPPAPLRPAARGVRRATPRGSSAAGASSPRAGTSTRSTCCIEQHNEYYPIERNLPISMKTGEYLTLSGQPAYPRAGGPRVDPRALPARPWRPVEPSVAGRAPRLTAVLRDKETVTPLELFFDLVFVLALTQCTALMADDPTWEGVARGLLILGVLWWSWVGYSWLTSVVDPEEGVVRLAIFGAMAALLVAALCVPDAFDDNALLFACAYGVVRVGPDRAVRRRQPRRPAACARSVIGLAVSTAIGVGLLVAASFTDGALQGGLWALALALDMAGPVLLRLRGLEARARALRRAPRADHHHRAGRVDRRHRRGRVRARSTPGWSWRPRSGRRSRPRCGGCTSTWSRWSPSAGCRTPRSGREQNEIARDSFSFLHLPMVAGIVLVALGLKKTLGHVDDPLEARPGGGADGRGGALPARPRGLPAGATSTASARSGWSAAVVLLALIPVALEIPALASVASAGRRRSAR